MRNKTECHELTNENLWCADFSRIERIAFITSIQTTEEKSMTKKPANLRGRIRYFGKTCTRLIRAIIKGASAESNFSFTRKSDSLCEHFRNAVVCYFAPLTGAYQGLMNELDRIKHDRSAHQKEKQ
jgi:hypothetical protein